MADRPTLNGHWHLTRRLRPGAFFICLFQVVAGGVTAGSVGRPGPGPGRPGAEPRKPRHGTVTGRSSVCKPLRAPAGPLACDWGDYAPCAAFRHERCWRCRKRVCTRTHPRWRRTGCCPSPRIRAPYRSWVITTEASKSAQFSSAATPSKGGRSLRRCAQPALLLQ
jgi:hypothetical protein